MTLKEILGDKYHDEMTFEEVEKALEGKNLADLSTGGYVSKEKHDRAVADLKSKNEAYDELVANTKDYEDLKKFKADTEATVAKEKINSALKEAGFSEEYIEYGNYLIGTGKIKNDDKLLENARSFLDEHKQYGKATEPSPTNPQPSSTVSTSIPNGTGTGTGEYEPPKIGVRHSWNQ